VVVALAVLRLATAAQELLFSVTQLLTLLVEQSLVALLPHQARTLFAHLLHQVVW
jgi:hypothetical protein